MSIIIPAHNAVNTLAEALQSLMPQRIREWEAIIVDDGSTDATPALAASWRARDSRIRYVRQAQSGVSRARNTGLLHARAEMVMFLDADDWISPYYFEQMFAALAENPETDVVYCGYVRISDNGWELPMSFSWDVASAPFEAFGHHCAVAIHCLILRRQVVFQAGGFDPSLKTCEDWDLWLRVARTGASFVGVPLPLAYYRMRADSASANYVHMINDARQVIERSRSADPRVKRATPRHVDGLRDDAVVERLTYFAIWCAACEAANGRTGVPALNLLGPIPDMRDNANGISDCLFHGLSVGGRRPSWALIQMWRVAEPCLVEICERLESASTRPGLTRCIMENLETRVVRACDLRCPQTLWRMCGYRIDVRGPVPDIEAGPNIDNVYLRVTDGKIWLDEIHYPLLGRIGARELARLILETWGFDGCLDDSWVASRVHFGQKAVKEIARHFAILFQLEQGRGRHLRGIINIIWRGLRCGTFLATAGAPALGQDQEPTHQDRAATVIKRHQKEIDALRAPTAAGSRRALLRLRKSVPEIQELPLDFLPAPEVERRIAWGGAIVRRSEAFRREITERVPILMYHRVSDTGAPGLSRYRVDPRIFEQQLQFLRRHGYYTITADNLLKSIRFGRPLRGRPIMLTFDDAYLDFYETVWPLLQRYDFEAQVFVVTDEVARCADWDKSYGEPAPLMDWNEIGALNGMGVSFGSHLATHRAADCLSTEELLSEAASSRIALETRLKSEVHSVAFPFGIHSSRVINTLKLCGYQIGFTTNDGIASIRMEPMKLPRLEIMGSDDLAAFACKIGRKSELERTRE